MVGSGAANGRIVFDLSSGARWTGPPVGIIRAQLELARWLRRERPDSLFVIYDPVSRGFRLFAPDRIDAFIAGRASLNAWAMPDPTGARPRRSAALPAPVYAALQMRRTLLRILERVRLANDRPRAARLADIFQRALITPRYRAAMLNPDGTRRDFLTPDMAFGEPARLTPADVLVCAGFGWSHGDIDAIAAAKAKFGFRFAVLCYDLIPLTLPHFFEARDVANVGRYWRAAFPLADAVIVNSRAVAADVGRFCAEEDLDVVAPKVRPLGVTPAKSGEGPLPGKLEPGRYALFVSTIEPRKGHEMLHRVWLSLAEARVPQTHGFKLVFVGRTGWMMDRFDAQLRSDVVVEGSLVRLEGLGDETLDLLYRQAAFCLYPSVYEGYGLPLVEAFARGKAVIASSGGALAEVAAGFSPTLDPYDEAAWRDMIRLWIEDRAARAPYEAALRSGFAHPTWDEAAAQFFEAATEAAVTQDMRPAIG
jgi:glycosyltransferase involved in cell wall biosynthesis